VFVSHSRETIRGEAYL